MSLNYRSKNQVVYETIRDAIISGEFAPGSRIVIDDLADKLGVSHSPIRECLRQLESDGFVHIRPYAGVTVTDLQPEFITEVFAILESMEVISSCRASDRMTDEEFDELEQVIAQMGKIVESPKIWSEKNIELHLRICDLAETPLVKDMMHKALRHWNRLRSHYLQDVSAKRIATAHQDHQEIVSAMRQRDTAYVEQLIRQHNQTALSGYLEHIKRG